LLLYDNQSGGRLGLRAGPDAGLANVAATSVELLGSGSPMWCRACSRVDDCVARRIDRFGETDMANRSPR
jgi:hypothetical protein